MKKNILIALALCTGGLLTARAADFSTESEGPPTARLLAPLAAARRAIFVLEDLSVIKVEGNGLTFIDQYGYSTGPSRRPLSLALERNAIIRWEMNHTEMLQAIERYKEVIFADYR